MSPEQFVKGFDPEHWLTVEEIVSRLDASGYWDALWPTWSRDEKIAYVMKVYQTWGNAQGEWMIASRLAVMGPDEWALTYKLAADVTPAEFRMLYFQLRHNLHDRYPALHAEARRLDTAQVEDDDDTPFVRSDDASDHLLDGRTHRLLRGW